MWLILLEALGALLVLALIVWWIALYNGLVGGRNNVKNAFAQIDVQLKRRFDLVPNLVETAKAYLKHERETLDAVIRARHAHCATPSCLPTGVLVVHTTMRARARSRRGHARASPPSRRSAQLRLRP